MNRQTQALALGFIAILLGSAVTYWVLDDNPSTNEDDSTEDIPDAPKIYAELNSSLALEETLTYRGENFPATLNITSNTTVSMQSVEIWVHDMHYNRTGSQIIDIGMDLASGTTQINFTIEPSFPEYGGAVISVPGSDYNLTHYELNFNTTQSYIQRSNISNTVLKILEPPVYDQIPALTWSVPEQTANISIDNGTIELNSSEETNYTISSIFNGTGYTRIDLNNSLTGANIQYQIDNNNVVLSAENYLSIGNYKGLHNFSISGTIFAGGSISIELAMLTKSVTLFGVIADNNWNGSGTDNFNFRNPSYYIKQMSHQFEETFNVSIIPSVRVDIATPPNTTLLEFAQSVINQVGFDLRLNSSEWNVGPASSPHNEGFDLLLIFTNKTMDHLGVVYGNSSGAFNLAIHSRGSLNTGNYRLPPSFADNLIQHEVSHVFGAPDRFTSSSPSSIMSKSLPSDAVYDIIAGEFWLFLTNWLETDIQTMTEVNRSVFW